MSSTSNPYEITNEIKKDLGKTANKLARRVAEIALDDMILAHKEIMRSYYNGYTPVKNYKYFYRDKVTHEARIGYAHGYNRINNLGENSRVPIGIQQKGKHGFNAIFHVSGENMEDYTNSSGRVFPGEAVFNMVWNEGIRGLPPGYRGHVGDVNIKDVNLFGIDMQSHKHKTTYPDDAMIEFV